MNTEHPDHTAPPQVPQRTPRVTEPTAAERTPHGEASELARRTDPSLKKTTTARGVDRFDPRSVAWVRLSDALSASTAQLAGRGISFEAELHRRIRRLPVQTVAASRTAISRRSHRLPPVTAFGHTRSHGVQAPARSGVGMAR